jgi:hypothetical protein
VGRGGTRWDAVGRAGTPRTSTLITSSFGTRWDAVGRGGTRSGHVFRGSAFLRVGTRWTPFWPLGFGGDLRSGHFGYPHRGLGTPKVVGDDFSKNTDFRGFLAPGQKPRKIGVGLGTLFSRLARKKSDHQKVRGTLTFGLGGQNRSKT